MHWMGTSWRVSYLFHRETPFEFLFGIYGLWTKVSNCCRICLSYLMFWSPDLSIYPCCWQTHLCYQQLWAFSVYYFCSLIFSTFRGMGIGAFLEPLVVVTLLLGGTWINRSSGISRSYSRNTARSSSLASDGFSDKTVDGVEHGLPTTTGTDDGSLPSSPSRSLSPSLLLDQGRPLRARPIGLWSWKREIMTPNTAKFRNRCFSRLLRRFPFLVECWYWTLVYWVGHLLHQS